MIENPRSANTVNKEVSYTTPDNHEYFHPTPGKITLLAISANEFGILPDQNLITGLKECGFNAAIILLNSINLQDGSISRLGDAVKRCHDSGIIPFINTTTLLTTSRNALVKSFANNPNLGGWSLSTPGYPELETTGTKTVSYNEIWKTDKTGNSSGRHIILMSAHPTPFEQDITYRDYLIRFQDNIAPSLWSTTVYPTVLGSSGNLIDSRNLFFRDLEIFSLISRYCERPFHYSVICMSYLDHTGVSIPKPTLEQMRFSAFSALAYGAQGLNFWAYRERADEILNGVVQVSYSNAPLNRNGTKNMDVWPLVQTINREVSTLNDVFFETYCVDVRHTGIQFDATKLLSGSFGPLISITTQKEGVLLSHLNTKGQDYLIIVNHGFRKSVDPDFQSIVLNFAEYSIKQVKAVGSQTSVSIIQPGIHRINLPVGGYLIYRWN